MNDGYMGAAAVPVPDAGDDTRNISREEADFNRAAKEAAEQTGVSLEEAEQSLLRLGDAAMGDEHAAGDDTLREQLAEALTAHWQFDTDNRYEDVVDALLPRIRAHVAADSPQRLFGRLISTAKGREILDANGIHGVERAEKAEAAIRRVRAVIAPWSHRAARRIRAALDGTEADRG